MGLALAVIGVSASACSQAPAAHSAPPAPASDPPAMGVQALAARPRDDKTMAAATPYEDRHGRKACASDCDAHEAGYKWAALHTLKDPGACDGLTPGFIDGCRAYARDHS